MFNHHNIIITSITLIVIMSAAPPTSVRGQDVNVVAASDLHSALPASQWIQIEAAVDRGLASLIAAQRSDGQFEGLPEAQPAITSLVVMAMLSRGHLPDSPRYGDAIRRAITFVLATQNRQGVFTMMRTDGTSGHLSASQSAVYNHMIAGLMLGEVYGMTGRQDADTIAGAIERALIVSRSIQSHNKEHPSERGGWRYTTQAQSADLSVTGWSLMFLRSARNAEFDVPKSHFDEGLDFVSQCYVDDPALQTDGVFAYRSLAVEPPKVTLANTGSGMLSLLLGGRVDHPAIAGGTLWYRSQTYPAPADHEENHYYLSTYYSSQAMAQVGGDAWREVYPQIARNLLAVQTEDGSWPRGRGSETKLGRSYTTALAVLALTPPFQLLPIYQR